MDRFKKIKILQIDIDNLFKKLDNVKQKNNINRLIKLNNIIDYYKNIIKTIIDNLFDAELNINIDDSISDLDNIKKILIFLIKTEQDIKETLDMNLIEQKLRTLIRKEIKKTLQESYMSRQYGNVMEKLHDSIQKDFNGDYLNFLTVVGEVISEYDSEIGKKIKIFNYNR